MCREDKAMGLREKLVRQFGNPRGVVGKIAGFIMSHRTSNRERIRWAVSLLEVRTSDHVLETGFGPGIAIQILSSLASDGVVYGIDHSPLMVRQASRLNRSSVGTGHVKLMAASVSQLPSFGNKLDKVLDVNSFQFWPDPLSVLQRVKESLRPGGLIAIAHQPRSRGATQKDAIQAATRIAEKLTASGFEGVHTEVRVMKPVPTVCVMARRPA